MQRVTNRTNMIFRRRFIEAYSPGAERLKLCSMAFQTIQQPLQSCF